MRKTKVDKCMIIIRPYISDSGAKKSGPMAKPNKNIDTVMLVIVGLVIPNSLLYASAAGATILDAKGVMKVYIDVIIVIFHFRLLGKFLGFAGSSGPSLFGANC